MADFFNKIVYTDSTGEEITLDQSTSVATVDASTLSVAEAQHAVNADHATSADNATNANHAASADSATKATQDGSGNNIAFTYATQSALTSGLNTKANTAGTYPNLTAGTVTTAGVALLTVKCSQCKIAGYDYNGAFAFNMLVPSEHASDFETYGGSQLKRLITAFQVARCSSYCLASGRIQQHGTATYLLVPYSASAKLYCYNDSGTLSELVVTDGAFEAVVDIVSATEL